jgi:hypothetical protein
MAIKSRAGMAVLITKRVNCALHKKFFKHGLSSSDPSNEKESYLSTSLTNELVDY